MRQEEVRQRRGGKGLRLLLLSGLSLLLPSLLLLLSLLMPHCGGSRPLVLCWFVSFHAQLA